MHPLHFVMLAVLVVGLGVVSLRLWAQAPQKTKTPSPAKPPAPSNVSVGGVVHLDRGDLQKRLRNLPPKVSGSTPSAMCYKPAAPPTSVSFVCRRDGSKTAYTKEMVHAVRDAEAARQAYVELRKVAGDSIILDDAQFCRKCNPKVKNPRLVLVVNYGAKGAPHKVEGVRADDLVLLREFLKGQDSHKGARGEVTALKDHQKRLVELLGIDYKKGLDRAALRDRLKALPQKPKEELKPGAMCYEPVPSPIQATYVCPKCGQKTAYVKENVFRVKEIETVRRAMKELDAAAPGAFVLDETEYCRKCHPKTKDPQVVLTVRMAGDSESQIHKSRGVTAEDLVVLREFIEGKDVHRTSTDAIVALKDFEPRINSLLGLEPLK